jgi:hypothetical protein
LSELLGAILLTFGFLRALTPMGESLWQTVKEPAARRHGAHSAGSEPES